MIVAADGLTDQRSANPDEVKRLGDQPAVIRVAMDGAAVEVAADGAGTELLLGPYRTWDCRLSLAKAAVQTANQAAI